MSCQGFDVVYSIWIKGENSLLPALICFLFPIKGKRGIKNTHTLKMKQTPTVMKGKVLGINVALCCFRTKT